MRYIIRKFVDADSVADALVKAEAAPIHDCYLKEGEEPTKGAPKDLIGFKAATDPFWRDDERIARRR